MGPRRIFKFDDFLGPMECTKLLAHLHAKVSKYLAMKRGAYEIARYDKRFRLVKSIISKTYAQTSDGKYDPLLCR